MNTLLHPFVVYGLCCLGALGVLLALPRGSRIPQAVGGVLAGTAAGVLLLLLGVQFPEHLPNVHFYIFGGVALAGALRVITHPKPVYAALYFVLTVLASAGLFLILSAEFMAFALIIVYAGAILITYLFVIMLATQGSEEDEVEALTAYDTESREPMAATAVGFVLLAVLTTFMFQGAGQLREPAPVQADALLAEMPRKVERNLRQAGLLREGESVVMDPSTFRAAVDADPEKGFVRVVDGSGATRDIPRSEWPEELRAKNVEYLGFNLLRDHPGTIEIAGVILLMAMLGAVVLSRKQVQIDEDAKRAQVRMVASAGVKARPGVGEHSGLVSNEMSDPQSEPRTGGGA